jgi:hypothetical protein
MEKILLVLFLIGSAITRIPGVLPPNFSVVYALMFCSGIFFKNVKWIYSIFTILITDVLLNIYYQYHGYNSSLLSLLPNYIGYGILIWMGSKLKPDDSFFKLISNSILGSIVFYFVTNTCSWISSPVYSNTVLGWVTALTIGTAGWPSTLEFYRNSILSTTIFTSLFVTSWKLTVNKPSLTPHNNSDILIKQ